MRTALSTSHARGSQFFLQTRIETAWIEEPERCVARNFRANPTSHPKDRRARITASVSTAAICCNRTQRPFRTDEELNR